MANKASTAKEELALALLKIVIEKNDTTDATKENVVEIYNYIYDNLHVPTDEVVIIDDIPRNPNQN